MLFYNISLLLRLLTIDAFPKTDALIGLWLKEWRTNLLALSDTKCKFVFSRFLKSERPIPSSALLSQRVFCNFHPPPASVPSDSGMAGWELSKLPAASHASSLAVTRRDGRHSTQLVRSTLMVGRTKKKKGGRNHIFFLPLSVICQFHWK